jgi:hypothetical protein
VALLSAMMASCADAADKAGEAFERAPYRVAAGPDGRTLHVSPDTVVIKRRSRILVWRMGDVSFAWNARRRCYDASTDFNRKAIDDQRDAPWSADATNVQTSTQQGTRVVTGLEKHNDFADTEFELLLDRAGRPTLLRARAARWGAVPQGKWLETAYAYPTQQRWHQSAGNEPRPICH